MSYGRRYALAPIAAGATLLMIAVFLHAFLCEWGLSSVPRPGQMQLLRIGPLGLFVRHVGYYPRTGIVLVGVLIPLILVVWGVWLYWSREPTYAAIRRKQRDRDQRAYPPRDNIERLEIEPNDVVPACVTHLGLEFPCTVDDVKAAYRQRSKAVHPDLGGDPHAFISLRISYEQAVDFVSRSRARSANDRVARIDPKRRAARLRPRRRTSRPLRWCGAAACFFIVALMALGSRWTVVYRTRDAGKWIAIGAGAIELISLDEGPSASRQWSIEEHEQPFIWWPIASSGESVRSLAVPLWTLLLAAAAPTVLLWRSRA